jgi:hypothetical protein
MIGVDCRVVTPVNDCVHHVGSILRSIRQSTPPAGSDERIVSPSPYCLRVMKWLAEGLFYPKF